MSTISYDRIIDNLKDGVSGVYFIYGDENYFIDSIIDVVKEKYRSNVSIFFGDDCDVREVLNNVYQQSIFNDFSVVLIRNIEGSRFINDKKNEDYIRSYVTNYRANAIVLLVCGGNIKKDSNLLKLFDGTFIYNSRKMSGQSVKVFIRDYCRKNGVDVTNDIVDRLYNCYDNNLVLITDIIDRNDFNAVSYFKDFNLFEVISYVSALRKQKLINIVNSINKQNKNDLFPLLTLLFNFFLKLLAYLNSYDKGSYQVFCHNAATLYKNADILKILDIISYSDCSLKGIESNIFDYGHVFKYLIGFIVSRG